MSCAVLRVGRICVGWICLGLAGALAGCGDSTGGSAEPVSLTERGRIVYERHCTVCHAADPRLAGSVGPEVAGSDRALLEARILRRSYPPGHRPRRNSDLMPAMPFLADDIEALASYLTDRAPEIGPEAE